MNGVDTPSIITANTKSSWGGDSAPGATGAPPELRFFSKNQKADTKTNISRVHGVPSHEHKAELV